MSSNTLIQPTEIIHLSGISWQTYERLLDELSVNRRLRLTYHQGNLEIMSPSAQHQIYKRVLGRFVETLAEELELDLEPLGSTTFKLPELAGAEPDECFYIQNAKFIRGKKKIVLTQDPPPDLVLEISVNACYQNRFAVFSNFGVSEIWRFDGDNFTINILYNQEYISVTQSLAFPNLPILEISRFLEQVDKKDYLGLVAEFRRWVKSQIQAD